MLLWRKRISFERSSSCRISPPCFPAFVFLSHQDRIGSPLFAPVSLIFLGCRGGHLPVCLLRSSSPLTSDLSSLRPYLFLCLSLDVNMDFVIHAPRLFQSLFIPAQRFLPLSRSISLLLRSLIPFLPLFAAVMHYSTQKQRRRAPVLPFFFFPSPPHTFRGKISLEQAKILIIKMKGCGACIKTIYYLSAFLIYPGAWNVIIPHWLQHQNQVERQQPHSN